ncbi:amyloid fiber anchoring/assembly protein TapA [Rossellomorea sp. LJF3]|uniref:amyloid fiber anchoring/assembly protein TapA n=1 Tax=Rossellomorea sp. LJF3 TaxID=3126099 RepID=UPI00300C4EA5
MIPIRFLRSRKYKTNSKRWSMALQLIAIWYMVIITGTYLSSGTDAYFNDHDQVTGQITAGTWEVESSQWDKSSLAFINKDQTIVMKACPPVSISTKIKNNGSEMKGTTEFEVFYKESGNPMKGNKIGDGIIQPIASKQVDVLTFEVNNPGNYKFRALQRPGHGNKDDSRQDLWSETVTVKCEEVKKSQEKEEVKSESEPVKEVEEKSVPAEKEEKTEPKKAVSEPETEPVKEEVETPDKVSPSPETDKKLEKKDETSEQDKSEGIEVPSQPETTESEAPMQKEG